MGRERTRTWEYKLFLKQCYREGYKEIRQDLKEDMKSQIQVTIATSLIEAGKDPLGLDKEVITKRYSKVHYSVILHFY